MLNALYDYHFHKSAAAENLLQAKQTNNNQGKTRDKEHRHFFSWILSVRVVENLQFLGHLHPAANLYCSRVAAVWSTLFEMQHEKDFTLAILRIYSKVLKSMAAF